MLEALLLWCVVGAIVCFVVGYWQGIPAEGAAIGLALGPFIGPFVVFASGWEQRQLDLKKNGSPSQPERQP